MTTREQSRYTGHGQVHSWVDAGLGDVACRVSGPALSHSLWVREVLGTVLVDGPFGGSNHQFADLDSAIEWALEQAGTSRSADDRFPDATAADLAKVRRAMRLDGQPGLVWYSRVRKVYGCELRLGDWLDSLDHHGARMIYGIWYGDAPTANDTQHPADRSKFRTVMFSFGDTEVVHAHVQYDVVDPNSQVRFDRTADQA